MASDVIIKDSLDGENYFESSAVCELITSQKMQRLRKISGLGLPRKYAQVNNFTLFENAIGTLMLLKHLDASIDDQIMGLKHNFDTHTAECAYQRIYQGERIECESKQTESNYGNMETNRNCGRPRADGSMELKAWNVDELYREITNERGGAIPEGILASLMCRDGRIVCNDIVLTAVIGRELIDLHLYKHSSYERLVREFVFTCAVKRAIEIRRISSSDFDEHDERFVRKIESVEDEGVDRCLNYLAKRTLPRPTSGILVSKEFKFINPEFIDKNGICWPLTSVDRNFRDLVARVSVQDRLGVVVPDLVCK